MSKRVHASDGYEICTVLTIAGQCIWKMKGDRLTGGKQKRCVRSYMSM